MSERPLPSHDEPEESREESEDVMSEEEEEDGSEFESVFIVKPHPTPTSEVKAGHNPLENEEEVSGPEPVPESKSEKQEVKLDSIVLALPYKAMEGMQSICKPKSNSFAGVKRQLETKRKRVAPTKQKKVYKKKKQEKGKILFTKDQECNSVELSDKFLGKQNSYVVRREGINSKNLETYIKESFTHEGVLVNTKFLDTKFLDEETKTNLKERWWDLRMKEIELYATKMKLLADHIKLVLEAMRSSSK